MEISIHAPRVGRDAKREKRKVQKNISIHAPRVGRDPVRPSFTMTQADFNPRAPCGARPYLGVPDWDIKKFQSTRPVWGATAGGHEQRRLYAFQSTRPVWGATTAFSGKNVAMRIFQSTRPVWGATRALPRLCLGGLISIHAPRVGRDYEYCVQNVRAVISIHAPRVGRDGRTDNPHFTVLPFQSTRPVWGATTRSASLLRRAKNFNPRAPCGARRRSKRRTTWFSMNFNPRAPCGARHVLAALVHASFEISIHAPRVGRDRRRQARGVLPAHFNPRAPCGARHRRV